MMTTMLQMGVYAVLILSVVYFGAVSVVGKAIMTGTVACGGLIVESRMATRRLRGERVLVPGQGVVGWFAVLWMFILLMSTLFSIHKQTSIGTLAVFLSYFFMFSIIVNTFDEKKLIRLYNLLFYFGCVLSLFGIFALLMKDITLFSVPKKYYLDRLTATYINPNHCASFLGMLIPCGGYFIIVAKGKGKLLYALGTFCMVVAFFLTFSLAAVLASALTVAGALFIGLLLLRQGANRKKIDQLWARLFRTKKRASLFCKIDPIVFLGSMLAIMAIAAVIVMVYRSSNIVTTKSFSVWERNNVYKGIIAMLCAGGKASFWDARTLLVGAGLGCFREIFHGSYATYSVSEFVHAHNEYLEQLIETGVGGLSVFLLMIACLAKKIWRYFTSGQNKERTYFVAALSLSVAFVLLHSFFDFPLRIPANGLLFFAMFGALTVLVRNETKKDDGSAFAGKSTMKKMYHGLSSLVNIVFFALACGMILFAGQNIAVQYLIIRAEQSFVRKDLTGVERCFNLARTFKPYDPELVRAYGEYLKSRAFSHDMNEKAYFEKVSVLYENAIIDNPRVPENYLRLAWILAQAKQFDQAEDRFNKALAVNPYFLISHIQRAHFYLYKNDLNKAAEGYSDVLDALMAMPYSPYSKANLLLEQLYDHMQIYPLHPALSGVYKRLVVYHEQFGAA
jgi:O-antigen ligase